MLIILFKWTNYKALSISTSTYKRIRGCKEELRRHRRPWKQCATLTFNQFLCIMSWNAYPIGLCGFDLCTIRICTNHAFCQHDLRHNLKLHYISCKLQCKSNTLVISRYSVCQVGKVGLCLVLIPRVGLKVGWAELEKEFSIWA